MRLRSAVALLVGLAALPAPALACTTATFKCSLQADAVPTSTPWTEPARVAYTFNNADDDETTEAVEGEDSFAIDAVGKAVFSLGVPAPVFALAELSWHRTNQTDKRQNDFQVAGGLHFEFDNTPDDGPITTRKGLYSIFADAKLGYARKSFYANATSAACQAAPDAIQCNTQHLESLRGTLDVSPHLWFFESEQKRVPADPQDRGGGQYEGPPVAYSFGTVASAFTDKILDNKVDPVTGASVRGTVTGLRGKAGVALSPKLANYRLVFRASAQWVGALGRSSGRVDDFPKSSHLFTASVDYQFGRSSFVEGPRSFHPAIGVTWTDGADPLTGKADQSTVLVGLKLSFK